MHFTAAAIFALASWPLALADVSIVYPSAGTTLASATKFAISWQDSGVEPKLTDLTKYSINLYSGSNTAPVLLEKLASGTYTATQTTAEISIPAAAGGTTANAYFIGIESEGKAGGTVINYSSRFTTSGMTGAFKAEVVAALKDVTDTSGPPTKNNVKGSSSTSSGSTSTGASTSTGTAATPSINPADGPYGTPYTLQTGLVRFAPMQPQPKTKITKTDVKPLWPTSSVKFATTYLPIPSIEITSTQMRTHSVESHPNTAPAQPTPSDDWEKYLDRWKDL